MTDASEVMYPGAAEDAVAKPSVISATIVKQRFMCTPPKLLENILQRELQNSRIICRADLAECVLSNVRARIAGTETVRNVIGFGPYFHALALAQSQYARQS